MGKTALLDQLSDYPVEIISADSLQVYRGLDIGTAKPTPEQLKKTPHHLIDIHNPDEPFHLGSFVKSAEEAVCSCWRRGVHPIISGGTAFYFKHLLMGLPETPEPTAEVRESVENLCREKGLPWCRERLKAVDTESAERIDAQDRYRILRALEVYETAGRPLSSYAVSGTLREDWETVIIGLIRPREELYARIDERVELMFSEGLVEEVRKLMGRGAEADWPGMKGIGYREFFTARESGEFSLAGIKELIKQHSRRYAKRQLTFFRSIPTVEWLHPELDEERIIRLLAP